MPRQRTAKVHFNRTRMHKKKPQSKADSLSEKPQINQSSVAEQDENDVKKEQEMSLDDCSGSAQQARKTGKSLKTSILELDVEELLEKASCDSNVCLSWTHTLFKQEHSKMFKARRLVVHTLETLMESLTGLEIGLDDQRVYRQKVRKIMKWQFQASELIFSRIMNQCAVYLQAAHNDNFSQEIAEFVDAAQRRIYQQLLDPSMRQQLARINDAFK